MPLQAFAHRTLTRKSFLVAAPKEPEHSQQSDSYQHHQDNEKGTTDRHLRSERRCRLLWSRCRISYRRVETRDDEVWRSTDRNAGNDASSRNIEHNHLAIGECHEAELPVAGDGDRLR